MILICLSQITYLSDFLIFARLSISHNFISFVCSVLLINFVGLSALKLFELAFHGHLLGDMVEIRDREDTKKTKAETEKLQHS